MSKASAKIRMALNLTRVGMKKFSMPKTAGTMWSLGYGQSHCMRIIKQSYHIHLDHHIWLPTQTGDLYVFLPFLLGPGRPRGVGKCGDIQPI